MNGNGGRTSFEPDAISVQLLVRLAETWGVSVDEALRCAVVHANAMIDASTRRPVGSFSRVAVQSQSDARQGRRVARRHT
jgi:hypothetical protein